MTEIEPSNRLRKTKICSMCSNIFACWDKMKEKTQPFKDNYEVSGWYKDALEYIASAKNGCVVCILLVNGRSEDDMDKLRRILLRGTKLKLTLSIRNHLEANEVKSNSGSQVEGNSNSDLETEDICDSGSKTVENSDSKFKIEDNINSDSTNQHYSVAPTNGYGESDSDQWEDDTDLNSDSHSSTSKNGSFDITCNFCEVDDDGKEIPLDLPDEGSFSYKHLSLIPISTGILFLV